MLNFNRLFDMTTAYSSMETFAPDGTIAWIGLWSITTPSYCRCFDVTFTGIYAVLHMTFGPDPGASEMFCGDAKLLGCLPEIKSNF